MTDTQLEIDIAEFVINNRDEILHTINHNTGHLSASELLFQDFPQMYDDLVAKARLETLKEIVLQHFNTNNEILSLIITNNFVKITLES